VPRPVLRSETPSATKVPGSVTANPASAARTGTASTPMQVRMTDRMPSVLLMSTLLLIQVDDEPCTPRANFLQPTSLMFSGTYLGCSIQPCNSLRRLEAGSHLTYESFPDLCKFPGCVKTFIMGPELPTSRRSSEPGRVNPGDGLCEKSVICPADGCLVPHLLNLHFRESQHDQRPEDKRRRR
jgi:hypothetical protein